MSAAISFSAGVWNHSRVRERAEMAMGMGSAPWFDRVLPVARAAVAAGADGVILDATSDVTYLAGQIHRLAAAMGREQ